MLTVIHVLSFIFLSILETAISDIGSEGLYISEDEPVWDVGNAICKYSLISCP